MERTTASESIPEIDVLIEPDAELLPTDPALHEAAVLFARDYARLMFEYPRYYAVLAILTKLWTHRMTPTLGVRLSEEGIHQLFINPAFYRQIGEQEHRLAILMHESNHIVLGHCVESEWPRYVFRKPSTFMLACELAANTHVPLRLPNRPVRPIIPGRYGLPEKMTTMEYFTRIVNDPDIGARTGCGARRRHLHDRSRGRKGADSRHRGKTDLAVLRAAAEVGNSERDVLAALQRDRLPTGRTEKEPEEPPDIRVINEHVMPDDDWLAEHCISITGDIHDNLVLARILNVLVGDVTRGYSLGGLFRSRTFRRPSRRAVDTFGRPGIRRSGGGPAMVLDLCFVVDATSSMRPHIEHVANCLFWMANRLSCWRAVQWRASLAWYRDRQCDTDYFRQFPFTRDIARVRRQLEVLHAHGGGDEPESAAYALYHVARRDEITGDEGKTNKHDPWRPNAKRVAFLVTDASCHMQDGDVNVEAAIRACRAAGIRVYVLGPWSWQPYQRMAEMTKGKLFRVDLPDKKDA